MKPLIKRVEIIEAKMKLQELISKYSFLLNFGAIYYSDQIFIEILNLSNEIKKLENFND